MKIFDDIELIDLAIFTNRTLIVTDFHIGYEEALNKRGLLVPRFQFQETMNRLSSIFDKLKNQKIDRIIINGDLKHEFGSISDQEWRHTLKLIDYFESICKEIILIKGNHDTILGPIAEKRKVKVRDHYKIETIKNNPIQKITIDNKSLLIINKGNYIKDKNIEIIKNKIKINNKTNKKIITGNKKYIKKISLNNASQSLINKFDNNQLKKTIINIKRSINKINIKRYNKITSNSKRLHLKINENNKKKIENIGKIIKNKILVIHGNIIPEKRILKDVSTIIIGHEHPAVSIQDGSRTELFKAFLVGKWHGKKIIAQPSFNILTEGTDVLKGRVLSPFLKNKLGNFDVIVVGDKLYGFGKIKNL